MINVFIGLTVDVTVSFLYLNFMKNINIRGKYNIKYVRFPGGFFGKNFILLELRLKMQVIAL